MKGVGDDDAGALGVRRERYSRVASSLALFGDRALYDLVGEASVIGSGIGGTALRLEVAGVPVFVKCVPLTDLERRPENIMSTANLFDLPVWCQYGVGSPGFGVWRELSANTMTTSWVRAGKCESFPLLYHWRVLDRPPVAVPLNDELADVERAVAYWHDSAAVRHRIDALVQSTAVVTMFFEYLPITLPLWLSRQVASSDDAAMSAIGMVERGLRKDVAFMNAAGLFHFDAHLGNILTDGRRLYFADFGLATSPRFTMSDGEREFLTNNRSHDACHTVTRLVDWLVTELAGAPYRVQRDAYIRRCLDGESVVGLSAAAAAVVTRYAPIAVTVNEFYRKLHLEDRRTPYPHEEIQRACDRCGFGTLNG